MKIKKGDTVKIIAGKDKGKKGKVVRAIPTQKKVAIEGINVYKKHVRPRNENEKGQIVEVARPINISNVQLICPSCNQATRIGIKRGDNNKRERFCKKCNANI